MLQYCFHCCRQPVDVVNNEVTSQSCPDGFLQMARLFPCFFSPSIFSIQKHVGVYKMPLQQKVLPGPFFFLSPFLFLTGGTQSTASSHHTCNLPGAVYGVSTAGAKIKWTRRAE